MGRGTISRRQYPLRNEAASGVGCSSAPVRTKDQTSGNTYPQKERGLCLQRVGHNCLEADLQAIVTDYDKRSGVLESNFCQDSQGLSNRKRRKRSFVAQQMLTSLCQLAVVHEVTTERSEHNLIRWIQSWMIDAVENDVAGDAPSDAQEAALVVKTLKERGMKRFVRQILSLSGKVIIKGKRVLRIILNPLYPLINRIRTALEALLKPYGINVSLGKT